MSSMSVSELRDRILVKKELTYGKAAKELGLNKGEVWHAVNNDRLPRADWKRLRLEAPLYISVPPCKSCGGVHTRDCQLPFEKRILEAEPMRQEILGMFEIFKKVLVR